MVDCLAKEKGMDVVVAGLDQDFKGAPFGQMPKLLGLAQKVRTLTAICVHEKEDWSICRKPAFFTQRLINGKPAAFNSPIILVGGVDAYTARCEEHWEVVDRPKIDL